MNKMNGEYYKAMNDENCKRPSLTFYHPNTKNGTGCALKILLRPATNEEDGCIELRMANQLTVCNSSGDNLNLTYPRFDWDSYHDVCLNFNGVALMLQVFRGECETINDGKGIYIKHNDGWTHRLQLHHIIDPCCGYMLTLNSTYNNDGNTITHKMLLSNAESLGLCETLAGSLCQIAFGHP